MSPAPASSPTPGRLLDHAAHGVLGWAGPLVVTFVTTPLIIKGLGPDGFAVFAWVAAFGAGIAASSPSRGVLHLVSRSTHPARKEAIATGVWMAVTLGSVAAAVTWALAGTAAATAQLPGDTAMRALRTAALGAVPACVIAVCMGAFHGASRFGTAATLAGVAALVTAAGSAWVATRGLGVVAVVTWQAIATTLLCVTCLLVLSRTVVPLGGRPTSAAAARVARFGLVTIGTQLATATWLIVERTLVGRYLGPDVLTALVLGVMLWLHAGAAIASAAQVVAAAGPADLPQAESRLARAYPGATTLTAIVTVAFSAMLAGLGAPAIALWIGPETAAQAEPLMLPLAAGLALSGFGSTAWFANEAEGRPVRNMLWVATGLVLNTALLLWLAPGGNSTVAGVARLVAVAPIPLFIAWTERASGGRLRAPWVRILTYLVPLGLALFAGLRMAADAAAGSWLVLIGAAVIGTAAYAALVWWLPILDERDRLALRGWFLSSRPSRSGRATER